MLKVDEKFGYRSSCDFFNNINMKICGPKLSLCGLIVSVWGIVQLVLMGIFYYVRAVALAEDLPLEPSYPSVKDFYLAADKSYQTNAYNCWIAACLYVFTLLFSAHQFYVNNRLSTSM